MKKIFNFCSLEDVLDHLHGLEQQGKTSTGAALWLITDFFQLFGPNPEIQNLLEMVHLQADPKAIARALWDFYEPRSGEVVFEKIRGVRLMKTQDGFIVRSHGMTRTFENWPDALAYFEVEAEPVVYRLVRASLGKIVKSGYKQAEAEKALQEIAKLMESQPAVPESALGW